MKNIILLLVISLPGYCFSQLHVSFSTGLAGFNMKEMKEHQSELKAQFPTDVRVVEAFPAFWFYELSLKGEITNQVRIGGAIGFTSTGGRMSYRDYSGEIECNQMTTALIAAIQSEVILNPNAKLPISLTCKTGADFSRYNLDISVDVNNTKDADNIKLNSINLFIEPGITACKRIVGKLSGTLNAGYNINTFKGRQKLVNNNDLFLLDSSGNEIRLNWSGFRLGVGLSVTF